MADYGIKYQIFYYRKSGGQTTIDILEKDFVESSIIELIADGNPLDISFDGDINNIYTPTLGSGATIRVRATPLTLQDLFTTDPQKFMVKIYDGESEESSGATNLVWQGFVSTGIYTESYSTPLVLKSQITIECNDGMALLDDIPYTQTVGGSNYTGYSTLGVVMKNIFDKLELDFLQIRTATDLEYDGHTNIFTCLSVNNENYYDEQGKAMSCREVLDSIFGALGLVVSLRGHKIYIIDPIHLHVSNSASKEYDTHPIYGSDEDIIGIGGYWDISNGDINWYKTGQNLDIIQAFNYIDISYDPYSFVEAGYDFNEEGNADDPGIYGEYTNNGVTYRVHTDITMDGWTQTGGVHFRAFEEISPNIKDKDYVIRQEPGGSGTFQYTFPFSNIQQDNGLALELSMDVFTNTRHVSNIFDPAESSYTYPWMWIQNLQVKVGSKWYGVGNTNSYGLWYDTEHTASLYVRELDATILEAYYIHGIWFRKRKYHAPEDKSVISDKWVTAFLYIPLSELYASGVSLVNGSITIIIPEEQDTSADANVLNVLIKNVNVQVVRLSDKSPITNDGIKTNAVIDSAVDMKKSTLDIKLTNGIGSYGVSKGAFCSDEADIAGLNITGLSRENSVEYNTNELLLQSLLGQYGSPRFQLTGTLNKKEYDYSDRDFHLIKDSNHLESKAFYIVEQTYHDREEYMDVTMIELTDTREEIT